MSVNGYFTCAPLEYAPPSPLFALWLWLMQLVLMLHYEDAQRYLSDPSLNWSSSGGKSLNLLFNISAFDLNGMKVVAVAAVDEDNDGTRTS